MTYQQIKNLKEIVDIAVGECKGKDEVINLIIKSCFSIDLIDNPFEGLFLEKARLWQAPTKPESLHINHGSYIHKYGNGIQYIIDQLKEKPDSKRALLSLINMKDIISSGDLPIPSFFVTQFSLDGKDLYCTVYFRALEVSQFLPINLTEVCLMSQQIRRELPFINRLFFCLHAFKAYYKPNFDTLARAEIDRQPRGTIAACVFNGQKERIRELLQSKFNDSSVIETEGVEELYNALVSNQENNPDVYQDSFIRSVGRALQELKELREIRTKASHGHRIQSLEAAVRQHISEALERL